MLKSSAVVADMPDSGLLNTLAHVRRKFQHPIAAIVGGTHLVLLTELAKYDIILEDHPERLH